MVGAAAFWGMRSRFSAAGAEVGGVHRGVSRPVERARVGAYADLAELSVQDVGAVSVAAHPHAHDAVGLALRTAAPGYVLRAPAVTVAEAPYALAGALVASLRVVGEVVAPDHVFGVGPGGPLEGRVDAQRPQVALPAFPIVKGKYPHLVGLQEDLTPAALPDVSPARGLRRRWGSQEGRRRYRNGYGDQQQRQVPHRRSPPPLPTRTP